MNCISDFLSFCFLGHCCFYFVYEVFKKDEGQGHQEQRKDNWPENDLVDAEAGHSEARDDPQLLQQVLAVLARKGIHEGVLLEPADCHHPVGDLHMS